MCSKHLSYTLGGFIDSINTWDENLPYMLRMKGKYNLRDIDLAITVVYPEV